MRPGGRPAHPRPVRARLLRHRPGESLEFGYPLLRLPALVECGTRALIAAAFGGSEGELPYAKRLLTAMDKSMLLLADAAFDGNEFLDAVHQSGARFLVRSGARCVPTPAEHLGERQITQFR
ncbi:hypothetical protein GCM10020367_58910 [Streptomyces sannanensis]|uniref:Transposase IS4-like domain-containing protein n=2 Tax=Streptomyces sannanensis TaxID=285536 RepID=A0ABP6SK70_9ACTN